MNTFENNTEEVLEYVTENTVTIATHELEEARDVISKLEVSYSNIGKLNDELRTLENEYLQKKNNLSQQLNAINSQLDELKKDRNKLTTKLTSKYGYGELDISTGHYTKK